MGKSAGSAPAAIDPNVSATAQARANIDAARVSNRMNRLDSTTPWGSVTYTEGPDDRWSQAINLDPRVQSALDSYIGQSGQPLDLSGLPGATGEARARVEQSMFDRINPQLDRDRAAMETQLRNQGLAPGSEAWTNAMNDWNRSVTDTRLGIVAQGGQEAMNTQNMELSRILAQRQVPLQELQSLIGMATSAYNGGSGAGGAGGTNVQPADYQSAYAAQQAAQNNAYQAKVSQTNSANATTGAVAAAAVTAAAVIA